MTNVGSFYGKKQTRHCLLIGAINQVDEDNPETADIIMIGPPTGGQDSNIEEENDDALKGTDMPVEGTGELEVFQFTKEDEKAPENSDNQPLVAAPKVKKRKLLKTQQKR